MILTKIGSYNSKRFTDGSKDVIKLKLSLITSKTNLVVNVAGIEQKL